MTGDVVRRPLVETTTRVTIRCPDCKSIFPNEAAYEAHNPRCNPGCQVIARSMVGKWIVHRGEGLIHIGRALPTNVYSRVWLMGMLFDWEDEDDTYTIDSEASRTYFVDEVEVLDTEDDVKAVWKEIMEVMSDVLWKSTVSNIEWMEGSE